MNSLTSVLDFLACFISGAHQGAPWPTNNVLVLLIHSFLLAFVQQYLKDWDLRQSTEPVKIYILLPLWTADGSKPSSDNGKKVDEDPRKDSECND
ncbi:hypothetical protein Tco_0450980 [Tanacetum coccineum]